jgi:hypothetical protein
MSLGFLDETLPNSINEKHPSKIRKEGTTRKDPCPTKR